MCANSILWAITNVARPTVTITFFMAVIEKDIDTYVLWDWFGSKDLHSNRIHMFLYGNYHAYHHDQAVDAGRIRR